MPHSRQLHTRVLIVGAGPAGLGVAAALKTAGVIDHLVCDAREIGAAFRHWPKAMAMLTPSFHSNAFGLTDLNAIDPTTSPADFLRTQHPTGPGYASYLQAVATHHNLPIETGIHIREIHTTPENHFIARADKLTIHCDFLIWAAGQFFTPRDRDFPGAEHAIHNSQVKDWSTLQGGAFTIIGGYESGIDAALNLIHLGKSVRLISRGEPWTSDHPDPSRSLSPRTFDRLREILRNPGTAARLEFIKNTHITRIEKFDNCYTLRDQDDIPLATTTRPILCNGFHSGLGSVAHLFAHDDHGQPIFTEEADDSTLTPNLCYTGPALIHRNSLFCFIYKFRARFGVIAAEIATRIGKPDVDQKLLPYLKAGFMNTDLDCCTNCQCAIDAQQEAPSPEQFSVQN